MGDLSGRSAAYNGAVHQTQPPLKAAERMRP